MLVYMSENCKWVITYRPTSWLLIVAILLAVFQPAHYHLHHLYDDGFGLKIAIHAHEIDLHLLMEDGGNAHHDEATSISISPEGIVKNNSPDVFQFILLAMVLLLLSALSKQINIRFFYKNAGIKQRRPHFTPLLRAPPLL